MIWVTPRSGWNVPNFMEDWSDQPAPIFIEMYELYQILDSPPEDNATYIYDDMVNNIS